MYDEQALNDFVHGYVSGSHIDPSLTQSYKRQRVNVRPINNNNHVNNSYQINTNNQVNTNNDSSTITSIMNIINSNDDDVNDNTNDNTNANNSEDIDEYSKNVILENNSNIDINKLEMIYPSEKKIKSCSRLFANIEGVKLIRYCQIQTGGKNICNKTVTFRDAAELSKRGSEKCKAHVKRFHSVSLYDTNILESLDLKFLPVRKLIKKLRTDANIKLVFPKNRRLFKGEIMNEKIPKKTNKKTKDNVIDSEPIVQSDNENIDQDLQHEDGIINDLTDSERFILAGTIAGSPFSYWETPIIKREMEQNFDELLTNKFKNAAKQLISMASRNITDYLRTQLKNGNINNDYILGRYNNRITNNIVPLPTRLSEVEKLFTARTNFLKTNVPYYISSEIDFFKSKAKFEYCVTIFNILSPVKDRVQLIVDYSRVSSRADKCFESYAEKLITNMNASATWINTCSNPNNPVPYYTTNLIGNEKYPLFAGHVPSLSHVLYTICESLTRLLHFKKPKTKTHKGFTIEKEEDPIYCYQSVTSFNISDFEHDPFFGKYIPLTIKLSKLYSEVRHSSEKQKLYDSIVQKRFSRNCSRNWESISDMLKIVVDYSDQFSQFFRRCTETDHPIMNELSPLDFNIATLLLGAILPYRKVCEYMRKGVNLSPIYIPYLLHVRGNIIKAANKLSGSRGFTADLTPIVSLIEKYLADVNENCTVLFTCTILKPMIGVNPLEYYSYQFKESFNNMDRVIEIFLKIFDFKKGSKDPHIENVVHQESSDENSNSPMVTSENFDQQLRYHIREKFTREYQKYAEFTKIKYETTLKKLMDNHKIYQIADDTSRPAMYQKFKDITVRISDIDTFLLKMDAVLEVQTLYRLETDNPNSILRDSQLMPVLLDYFLSIAVTSADTKRPINKLKATYGDENNKLSDDTITALAITRSVANSRLNLDILGDFNSIALSEALGTQMSYPL